MNISKRSTSTKKTYRIIFGLLIALIVASIVLPAVFATTPAANTQIKNSASATYSDAQGRPLTATSNEVITFVQQVDSYTLTLDNSKTATVGTQVVYPHTLTYTGNGTATINLAISAGAGFVHTAQALYIDANGDGIPDNLTPVTSVTLNAGDVYKFVAVGTVPAAATGTGELKILASGTPFAVVGNLALRTNTDTTTVTTYASVQITKALSTITGPSGTTTTVTLSYTNTGNATANNIIISDSLLAGWAFQTGTVRWSTTGATTITELGAANGTAPNTIKFLAGSPELITINQIPANTSGFVQFDVKVTGNPGIYTNFAGYSYQDGSVAGAGATISGNNTNTASFTIQGSAGVTIAATNSPVLGASPGSVVVFHNIVTSSSTVTDTYNITLAPPSSGSAFPLGSSFQLFKSDGNTPLADTNADGTPDTGPLAPSATYDVILKVTLPNNATATGAPFGVKKVATSTATGVLNQGATSNTTDTLTTVNALTMDLTQVLSLPAATATNGAGAYTPAVIVPSPVTVLPGASATFALYVNNTGTLADTYDMFAASTYTAGNASAGLTSGLTVAFRLGGADCSAANLGATVTNSGSVAAAGSKLVCAIVTTSPTFTGGTQEIYFLSKSPTTGVFDQIHDQISVTTVHNVTITPNQVGQIYPGGSVVYTNTLTNGGNSTESVTFTSLSQVQAGWTAVLYKDNGTTPGVLDPGDTPLSPGSLFSGSFAPGASLDILVKIQSVSSAVPGAVDVATILATYNGGSNTTNATETTTVIAGQLRLVKTQALDATCNGSGSTFVATDITTGAIPGACIIYKIVATNQGAASVTAVFIDDSTPAFTTYNATSQNGVAFCSPGAIVTAPTNGAVEALSCNVGTLAPGATATMTYAVKINP